jgi:hypothetical protein
MAVAEALAPGDAVGAIDEVCGSFGVGAGCAQPVAA